MGHNLVEAVTLPALSSLGDLQSEVVSFRFDWDISSSAPSSQGRGAWGREARSLRVSTGCSAKPCGAMPPNPNRSM